MTLTTIMDLVLVVSCCIILVAKSIEDRGDSNNDNGLSLDNKLLYNIGS